MAAASPMMICEVLVAQALLPMRISPHSLLNSSLDDLQIRTGIRRGGCLCYFFRSSLHESTFRVIFRYELMVLGLSYSENGGWRQCCPCAGYLCFAYCWGC